MNGFINNLGANINNEAIDKNKIEEYLEKLSDTLVDKLFDIFVAIVFLYLGLKVCKLIIKIIKKSFAKTDIEDSIEGFLLSLIKGILYFVVLITTATIMGFQVASLVTILGTASLAIGLALQGSLSNFAGGVLILIMKPFKVGDYIIENDKKCEGTVVAIDIFYTRLKTIDNKIIVIPNGNITANSIVNLSMERNRRLDIIVNVSYKSDIEKVKNVLYDIIDSSEYYNRGMDKNVYVDALGDSAIKMGLRFYVNTENYWLAKWEVTEQIKKKFDENNIIIPYNQLEISVKQ